MCSHLSVFLPSQSSTVHPETLDDSDSHGSALVSTTMMPPVLEGGEGQRRVPKRSGESHWNE